MLVQPKFFCFDAKFDAKITMLSLKTFDWGFLLSIVSFCFEAKPDGSQLFITIYNYDQVTNYLESWIFFLKKLLRGPLRSKYHDFWYYGPWPTIFWGWYFFGTPRPPLYVWKCSNVLNLALSECPVKKITLK